MFYDWLVFAESIFLSIYFTKVGTHGGGISSLSVFYHGNYSHQFDINHY